MPYMCLLCGRDKFDRPNQLHRCRGQIVKHFSKIARRRGMKSVFVKVEQQSAGLLLAAGEG